MTTPQNEKLDVQERFWAKVAKTETCWYWTSTINHKGYGMFHYNGKNVAVHRLSYLWANGSLPEKPLQLDHLCRNRSCMNPAYLEPVTPKENSNRGNNGINFREKTHCPNGHPYTGDNLIKSKQHYDPELIKRLCRKCQNLAHVKYRQKLKRLHEQIG